MAWSNMFSYFSFQNFPSYLSATKGKKVTSHETGNNGERSAFVLARNFAGQSEVGRDGYNTLSNLMEPKLRGITMLDWLIFYC
ncbi:hypothetical protein NC653_019817 [Populus alba x Populus x berolinensis]|uniref:Uncharacterized protein n=1 Tax=Populus alba x Populus x berolinensis TaxID=444605 RepID=A0AAD6MIY4_9ROSI|nr:hypothetical protein NC653_019817 [Populus alba x Populus x berolinensis]